MKILLDLFMILVLNYHGQINLTIRPKIFYGYQQLFITIKILGQIVYFCSNCGRKSKNSTRIVWFFEFKKFQLHWRKSLVQSNSKLNFYISSNFSRLIPNHSVTSSVSPTETVQNFLHVIFGFARCWELEKERSYWQSAAFKLDCLA